MDVKYCPKCPYFSNQLTKVVNHIGISHSAETNFSVFCGIGGCASTYRNFASYRSHLYRRHRDVLEENGSNFQRAFQAESNVSGSGSTRSTLPRDGLRPRCEASDDDFFHFDEDVPISASSGTESPQTRRTRGFDKFLQEARSAVWNFFFKVTEQHSLPHSAVEKLFAELEFVFEVMLKAYSEEISYAMKVPEAAADLERLLQCSFVSQMFSGLMSRRQREKYARETFPFVEPEKKVLGQNDIYHYVPVPKLLKTLSRTPDIVSHFRTPQATATAPTVYRDFTDGLLYREYLKDVIQEGSDYTILLLLYTDEVEVSNPLGPKRGVHKLLAVYCSLLNLHVKYRSQLQNIYLLLLVRYTYVKTYGLTAILQPLLDDLKELYEHGFSFEYRDSKECAQVLVLSCCGDNLSLNRLGGFSCCFSRGRVCRFCMVLKNDLPDKTSEDICRLRNAQRHGMHLTAISVNSITNRRLYGVNDVSPLSQLPYFDVTRQLPPDIMHDILEGGAECVLRQVLGGLVSSGLLSARDLQELSKFEYGPNDLKNKPVPVPMAFITGSAMLTGTASSKWCLLRFIPLILGGKIPESNEDWELLLQFREIVDIVFAPEIAAETVAYLTVLVQTFLTEFVLRYGRSSVTPKLHFLVHYPRFVRYVGPLKHLWSMRFEAKHQQFKKLAVSAKNFRNLTFTLCMRHQLRQSYQLHTYQLYEPLTTVQSKQVVWDALPLCAKEVLPMTAHQVLSATLDHQKYRCGSILVKQNEGPEFHKIESLYVARGKLFALTRIMEIEHFDRHRFCYRVQRTEQLQMAEAASQFQPYLLDLYHGRCIVPKWEIW